MQSGIEEINHNVIDLENEIKIEEKCETVPNEKDSISSDTQVETEMLTNVPENNKKDEKNVKILSPCLKARNSYEDIILNSDKHEKNYHYKSLLKNKSQNSDSNLVTKPTRFSKILTWDPWHKIGRNKKDKRKNEENKEKITVTDHNTGDGPRPVTPDIKVDENCVEIDSSEVDTLGVCDETIEDNLKPSPPKVRKIVRFHADVKVVHYADDAILSQTIEPLKKELEQQERNKELRKEFCPETGLGLKHSLKVKKSASDYMAAWYKK